MFLPLRECVLADLDERPPPDGGLLLRQLVQVVDGEAEGDAHVVGEHLLLAVALGLDQAEDGLGGIL